MSETDRVQELAERVVEATYAWSFVQNRDAFGDIVRDAITEALSDQADELARLRATSDARGNELKQLRALVNELSTELERLYRLVARLPLDGDGNKLTIGDKRWVRLRGGNLQFGEVEKMGTDGPDCVFLAFETGGCGAWLDPSRLYAEPPEPPAPKVQTLRELREALSAVLVAGRYPELTVERLAEILYSWTGYPEAEAGKSRCCPMDVDQLANLYGKPKADIEASSEESRRQAEEND